MNKFVDQQMFNGGKKKEEAEIKCRKNEKTKKSDTELTASALKIKKKDPKQTRQNLHVLSCFVQLESILFNLLCGLKKKKKKTEKKKRGTAKKDSHLVNFVTTTQPIKAWICTFKSRLSN